MFALRDSIEKDLDAALGERYRLEQHRINVECKIMLADRKINSLRKAIAELNKGLE